MEDENTFLFTFKDNQPKKFDILDKSNGFILNDKSEYELFSFGIKNMAVMKNGCGYSYQDKKYFDFKIALPNLSNLIGGE